MFTSLCDSRNTYINKSYALTLNTGDVVFMKANEKSKSDMFKAEAAGLNAIASTKTIRTPDLLCAGTDDGQEVGYSFLLMKYIKSGERRSDYWETFARDLAALHQADAKEFSGAGAFGFFENNFVGSTAQDNSALENWISFFRERRLEPQIKKAASYFSESQLSRAQKLLDRLEDFLIEPKAPSLLHGDLWSGNVMAGPDGKAMLIDPAAYVGHAEADIAMTQLFGGFPREFYDAYKEANPMEAGYEDRRDLYNLYQLLNHLNLFGQSYLDPVISIIDEYVG
ncbi:MAG: fructosamine kinase family protein [Treponema sp.]|nr:fructosamine kinase family protein [Treponema sp.]